MNYFELAIAIIAEVIATNFLKASAGFTRLIPSIITIISYIICFYSFSLSLKTLNLSVAYATWSGVGIILTTIIGIMIWHQNISLVQGFGIALIIIGVVVTNLASSGH